MNARRATNLSPSKVAILITQKEEIFKWSGHSGKMYFLEADVQGEVEFKAEVPAEEADRLLSMSGWKPAGTTSRLEDWMTVAVYRICYTLHFPGFRK